MPVIGDAEMLLTLGCVTGTIVACSIPGDLGAYGFSGFLGGGGA